MDRDFGFSSSYKYCEFCGRPLPSDYEKDFCPSCEENNLFREVKDFIRSHDVNEYQVAAHFQIPVRQIKQWIREGRIEYKESTIGHFASVRCQNCGISISFGTLCPKCLRVMNSNMKGFDAQKVHEESRMRYLDNNPSTI